MGLITSVPSGTYHPRVRIYGLLFLEKFLVWKRIFVVLECVCFYQDVPIDGSVTDRFESSRGGNND